MEQKKLAIDLLNEWNEWMKENDTPENTRVPAFTSARMVFRDSGRLRDPVSAFGPPDFRVYTKYHRNKKYSTIAKNLNEVRKFFKWCVKMGHVESNPVESLKVNKDLLSAASLLPRRRRAFTPEHIERLITHAPTEDWRIAVWVAYETGLRLGDVSCLIPEAIDYDDNCIMCRLSKTDEVFTTGEITQALTDKLRDMCSDGREYVFPSLYAMYKGKDGKKYSDNVLSQYVSSAAFKNVCKECGVPPLGFHAIRRTFASMAYNKASHMEQVQKQLGHSDSGTTAHYVYSSMAGDPHENMGHKVSTANRGGDNIIDFKEALKSYVDNRTKVNGPNGTGRGAE